MTNYVLEIAYREGEAPIHIRLPECDADTAETKRQALVKEIDHAREIGAPVLRADVIDADLDGGVTIDPSRVTNIALIDAADAE